MPFNGAGAFTPPGADFPAVAATIISSASYNNVINDLASGLTGCITKDGQTTVTANLPMAGFKHTGVADSVARSDYASYGKVQDGAALWAGNAGGTANALTLTMAPAVTAYVAGQVFRFVCTASNTGPATVAVNGLAAKAIQIQAAAIAGGDILLAGIYEILYDGTAFQLRAISVPAWSTGDVKLTYKTAADAGWVLMNDLTIGNAVSGATGRANADTVALYTLLWNNTINADCAVSTGRGANAAADYAANKTIALPKTLGRALACYGAGAGLTARTLATIFGEELHVLTNAEGAPHVHNDYYQVTNPVTTMVGDSAAVTPTPAVTSLTESGFSTGGQAASGTGTGHNTLQPTVFLNVMVKL